MNKIEIIAKIEDLYGCLRDNEYNSWYNRSTMTAWKDSSEYSRYSELNNEQKTLIDALEEMLRDDNHQD